MADPIVDFIKATEDRLARLETSKSGPGKPADPLNKSLDNLAKQVESLKGRFDHTDLPSLGQNLRRAAEELRMALPAARAGRTAEEGRPWLLRGLIAALAALGLLAGFAGGVVYTRSGLAMTNEAGCKYLGGQWAAKQDGSSFVCWREAQ